MICTAHNLLKLAAARRHDPTASNPNPSRTDQPIKRLSRQAPSPETKRSWQGPDTWHLPICGSGTRHCVRERGPRGATLHLHMNLPTSL